MENLSILASDLDHLQYCRKAEVEVTPSTVKSVQAISAIILNAAQTKQLASMVNGTHLRVTVASDGNRLIAFYTDYADYGHYILWEDGVPELPEHQVETCPV
jgi:hypothetical protein